MAPSSDEQQEVQLEEATAIRKGPPVPNRGDTIGSSTRNSPKPPSRYADTQNSPNMSPASPSYKPKPALPPRLPPRNTSFPSHDVPQEAPPPYSQNPSGVTKVGGPLNRGALSRLGSAGIRVPGLGIGEEPASPASGPGRNNGNSGRLDVQPVEEQGTQSPSLQSRFSNLSTKPSSSPTEVPAQGTSFAQKQAALKTASAFRKDPTSVSLADAKATAATANNFRQRHGEQVAAGWQAGNALNKKYDIANRLSDRTGVENDARPNGGANDLATSDASGSSPLGSKGRPAPPVPKKPFVEGTSASAVPPVPWSSKPRP